MKIGLCDVDSHNFPNLCLMKLSAHHKARGDPVEWWRPDSFIRHRFGQLWESVSISPIFIYHAPFLKVVKIKANGPFRRNVAANSCC